MNVFCCTGRLGRDAETRTTQAGDKVTSFSVANEIGFGDRRQTVWIDCALWGDRGGKLAPHLKKGTLVAVNGEASVRTWQANGETKAVLSVRVGNVTLLGGKTKPDEEQSHAGNTRATDDLDDEVPF